MTNQRDKRHDEKRRMSNRVSDLCRYIGFGVVAVTWTLVTSTSDFATGVTAEYRTWLMLSASGGILTVLFDYLQYLAGYWSANEALSREDNLFDDASLAYKSRRILFWAKQASAIACIVILIVVVIGNI